MTRKPTNDDRRYAIELYVSGLSARKVAAVVGFSDRWVKDVVLAAGTSRSRKDAALLLRKYDRDAIVRMYLSGSSSVQIGAILGIDPANVRRIVGEAGVSRSCSEAFALRLKRGDHPRFRKDISTDVIAERYAAGEGVKTLVRSVGLSACSLKKRLIGKGIAIRPVAEARALVDREQMSAARAETRSRKIGFGEDILRDWLIERGERPELQFPVGVKNIDLAIAPVAVEVWLGTSSPIKDPYCRERIEYLADRGWCSWYVVVSRRTRVLLPSVADEIVASLQDARRDPTTSRQHRVIRGCGEVAAVFGPDLDDVALIPPSVSCPHHRSGNRR